MFFLVLLKCKFIVNYLSGTSDFEWFSKYTFLNNSVKILKIFLCLQQWILVMNGCRIELYRMHFNSNISVFFTNFVKLNISNWLWQFQSIKKNCFWQQNKHTLCLPTKKSLLWTSIYNFEIKNKIMQQDKIILYYKPWIDVSRP